MKYFFVIIAIVSFCLVPITAKSDVYEGGNPCTSDWRDPAFVNAEVDFWVSMIEWQLPLLKDAVETASKLDCDRDGRIKYLKLKEAYKNLEKSLKIFKKLEYGY